MLRQVLAAPPKRFTTWPALWLVLLVGSLTGCGSSGPEGTGVPSRSGEVWEIDGSAGRSAMSGAVLAYVNGLHVIVLDGNNVYAGMTLLKAERPSDGGSSIKLANGLEASLVPTGEGTMDLRFSSGESIPLRRK
ncbi:MAG: hypothetical protein AB1898_17700 [Acidobacteriota bacterium]